MKRILALILIMLIIIPYESSAGELTDEQRQINAIEKGMEATVKITVNSTVNLLNTDLPVQTATGFFISKGKVLTNAHVVIAAGVTKIELKTYDGKTCKGTPTWRDEDLDLAIVETTCEGTPLELAQEVTTGQDVYIIGHPLSLEWVASKGIVSHVYEPQRAIMLDVNVSHGSSGSPIINSDGNIIGIIDGQNKEATYLAFGIHLYDVRIFLQRAGVM